MSSDEIDLAVYFGVLKKRFKLFFLILLLVTAAGTVKTVLTTKQYLSQSLIMPLDSQSGSALSLLKSQFSAVPMLPSMGGMTGSKKLQIHLNSSTFANFFVSNLNVIKLLVPEYWDVSKDDWSIPVAQRDEAKKAAIDRFKGSVTIDDNNDGTVKVGATWTDSSTALYLADQMLSQLEAFMAVHVFTESRKDRIFLEKQLELNQKDLLETGKKLSTYYQSNQISASSAKTDVDVSITNENPINHFLGMPISSEEIKNTIDALKKQKNELEQKAPSTLFVNDVPQGVYLEYLTMKRGILVTLNSMLSQQYQLSRIDEIKDEVFFTVIDKAELPTGPFKPNVRLAVIISIFLGFFVALVFVFVTEYVSNMRTRGSVSPRL